MYILAYYIIAVLIATLVIIIVCKKQLSIAKGVIAGAIIGAGAFVISVLITPCGASIRIYDYFISFLFGLLFGGGYGLVVSLIYRLSKSIVNTFRRKSV